MPSNPATLDPRIYRKALSRLSSRDADLGGIVKTWGAPPFWTHEPGFPGIVISILAQQVSLESAEAAFAKLGKILPSITPDRFLTLRPRTLKKAGFSRQKASYVRGIAKALLSGDFDLRALKSMDNNAARLSLVRLKGIGPWTADAYLLFALRRADAWPTGDLALIKAIQEIKRLRATPSPEKADAMAEKWVPWRGVAARMLWYHYLCSRGRITPDQAVS